MLYTLSVYKLTSAQCDTYIGYYNGKHPVVTCTKEESPTLGEWTLTLVIDTDKLNLTNDRYRAVASSNTATITMED